MRVLVTGASGFIGCHIVARLLDSGHEVRAFVRSRDKLAAAMAPFGVDVTDVRIGDVTDRASVVEALAGCDAVVNAANVYSYDPRQAKTMARTNVDGTRVVLESAVEAGCDPVVHVSTAQVSWPRPVDDPDPVPLMPLRGLPYSDSKKRAESIARALQGSGAPIVTTYPGAVLGPNDPGPGEQITLLRTALVPTAPFRIDGGFPVCDIDWITSIHVALLEPGLGPRRITCSGRYLSWERWFELAREITGRRLKNGIPTPDWVLRASGSAMDAMQRVIPSRLPFGREAGWILKGSYAYPDEEARAIAGPPPEPADSMGRAIQWAVDAGHLTTDQAGLAYTARS